MGAGAILQGKGCECPPRPSAPSPSLRPDGSHPGPMGSFGLAQLAQTGRGQGDTALGDSSPSQGPEPSAGIQQNPQGNSRSVFFPVRRRCWMFPSAPLSQSRCQASSMLGAAPAAGRFPAWPGAFGSCFPRAPAAVWQRPGTPGAASLLPSLGRAVAATIAPLSAGSRRLYWHCQLCRLETVS